MTRTDRYSIPLSGTSSAGIHATEDRNWEPDSSFAYQPPEEVLRKQTGQMRVSVAGTGIQPTSSKPPSGGSEELLEEEDSEVAEGHQSESTQEYTLEGTPRDKLKMKLSTGNWTDQGQFQSTTDDGDISSHSSAPDSSQSKGKAKWLQENGEYFLDRLKACTLHLLQEHYCKETSEHLTKELSEAIKKTCAPKNTERYKIELKQGITPITSDIEQKKPGRSSKGSKLPGTSQLQVDLDDDSELSKLVKSLFVKTSKKLAEVFGNDAEFDSAIIHRMTEPKHKIPYCGGNFGTDGSSSFSPTVGVLSLGSSGARPMFLKAATGGIVTHKALLHPGSLCFLGGRTAAHYRYSVPKEYGPAGEQYIIMFFQKTPSRSILDELKKIDIQEKMPSTPVPEVETPIETPTVVQTTVSPVITEVVDLPKNGYVLVKVISPPPEANGEAHEKEDGMLDNLRKNTQVPVNLNSTAPSSLLYADHQRMTPPTAILRDGFSFNFDDGNDTEPSKQLVLAETLDTVVDKMDHKHVAKELMRNGTSTTGNLKQMKNRLKRRITMTIGELSASALPDNSMISMLHHPSPDILPSNLTNSIQKISNCQESTDKTLENVLNEISKMKDLVNTLSIADREQKSSLAAVPMETPALPRDPDKLATFKKLFEDTRASVIGHNCKLATLTTKVAMLNENLDNSRAAIDLMADAIIESGKDMAEWRASTYSDELTTKIDYIHGYVQKCYPDTTDMAIQATEDANEEATEEAIEEKPAREEVSWAEESDISEDATKQDETIPHRLVGTPEMTNMWPMQSEPTLEMALKEGRNIKICLITDSIMRHITGLESTWQYKYKFNRIDCRDSTGLCASTTKDELKRKRPHLVYVHLGINDIHRGADLSETMNNIKDFDRFIEDWLPDTRIVISLPLDNGKVHHNRLITQLRSSMVLYGSQGPSDHYEKRVHIQHNNQMLILNKDEELCQNTRFFSSDKLHLSEKGMNAMHHGMRGTLHRIFKWFTTVPRR